MLRTWTVIEADEGDRHLVPCDEPHVVPINDHGQVQPLECPCGPRRMGQHWVVHNRVTKH